MKITPNILKRKKINFLFVGICLLGAAGAASSQAQERDPFSRPVIRVRVKRKPANPAGGGAAAAKMAPVAVAAPPIKDRIENYKTVRQRCAELGVQCPKPTSVLTIDEMKVTGVFRTPRGYAAMVKAEPIKLSYTIYPGEKFYDGQLVAIEEGKLVFRRVVQMSDGKQIVSASNKTLEPPTINDMASERAESQTTTAAPAVNPTVAVPTKQISPDAAPVAETGDVKNAGVPTKTGDAAESNASGVKLSQLPRNERAPQNIELGAADDAPAAQTAPAAKKPKKAVNKKY